MLCRHCGPPSGAPWESTAMARQEARARRRTTPDPAPPPASLHPRERILAAALDLFFRQGFRGTTVREITMACGLTPGAMYNHFPSKEAVLKELIIRAHDEIDAALEKAMAEADPDPVSQLRALVYTAAMYHCRNRPAGLVASFEYAALPDPERAEIVQRRRRARATIERTLTAGEKAGVFRIPKVDKKNEIKMAATAIANVAIRATEVFGPQPSWSDERVAEFHADLALQLAGVQ
jgi:AcrR family transcriptional regulator